MRPSDCVRVFGVLDMYATHELEAGVWQNYSLKLWRDIWECTMVNVVPIVP
jgi:hypothetical protein